MVFPLPPGVSGQQALTLQVQGLTAYLLLKEAARLQPGETILIHAAAGGVGTLLVQLAKLQGAGTVIATASTDEKLALAHSLGADATINYSHADWPQQVKLASGNTGVAIILDAVGGDVFQRSLECLAPFGRLINYGNSSGNPSSVNVWQLTVPNQSVSGFYLGGYFRQPRLIEEAYGFLFSHAAGGQLNVHIGQTLPLCEAAQAHRLLESRQTTGKVVLIP
ncbi:quinone oxidoreductase family protein [Spirosoma arcticum]